MMFRNAIGALALFAATANAATSTDYDYTDFAAWNNIPGSQCAQLKNSPVPVTSKECTRYENYVMNHGTCMFSDLDSKILKNGVWSGIKEGATCTKSTVEIPGIDDVYHFAQFHIHLSSEHTIDDKFYSAELHMVHLNKEGSRAAVVGTMIEASRVTDNPIFEAYLQGWRKERENVECNTCLSKEYVGTASPASDTEVHPYKLVEGNSFYHYDGGLTTPGCNEIVWWNLSDTSMRISVRQFNDMADIILNTHVVKDGKCAPVTVASKAGSTSRPVQKLNGRKIDRICPSNMAVSKPIDTTGAEEPESSATSAAVGVAGAVSFMAAVASQVL